MFSLKKFSGLMKKEWVLYRGRLFFTIIGGLALSLVVPYLLLRLGDGFTTAHQQLFFLFTILVLMLGNFYAVLQFFTSMLFDLKAKEMWLHSTSSIAQLVGVKIIFTLTGYAIFNLLFTSLALYFVRENYVATFGEVLLLLFLIVGMIVMFQFVLFVILLLFLAFYLQMKHFIGRFAIVIAIPAFFLSMDVWFRFTESEFYDKIFQFGEIRISRLEQYLPKAEVPTMQIELGSLYFVEEFFFIIVLALLFIVATKWLEKVVLR
ncbi:hypothetical protein [Lysinibacillus sphaericus]|uniref:hypothetical protein n=1 Tax=Lysinibacillus sphaericus TaxID=1421 RepID=UPI001E619289|nr:hypothetical protein [Lysinibacillus sphaericus]